MQVKTYLGQSTHEVLAKVKAELGPDAVILGSREVRRDGQRMYEVTAGIERAETLAGPPVGWEEWHQEWSKLKDHIYSLMQPAIQWEKLTPNQRLALEYLQKEGVEGDVIFELYQTLLNCSPKDSMLGALARLVPVSTFDLSRWPQRIHVLTGPFGGGKTTTALRLGMNIRQSRPGAAITFLNADSNRGNGRLALRHWSELSDFGYYETPDAATMKAALRESKNADIIFVDMQGLAKGETLMSKLAIMGLADLSGTLQGAVHLALPPHYGARQLESILHRHKTDLPCSLIWTKLDEAANFGQLVNVAVRTHLPISALSYGPELQASLTVADESMVWRLLLKRQLPGAQQAAV